MKHQAFRPAALMLSVLLVTAVPAQAGTLHFADVLRVGGAAGRGPATDLRLRAIQQQGGKAMASGVGAPQGKGDASANNTSSAAQPTSPDASSATTSIISQDPAPQQQGGTVETIDLGDVTGTVCDCGEIPEIPGEGRRFPWLYLAGIPLICLTGICTTDKECCDITTTPTPPIPEPATLLLFGSGLLALGAGARRRRSAKQLAAEEHDAEVA